MGSARVSRVGFDVASKQAFLWLSLLGNGEDRQEKFAIARTRSPTREPRVLPKPLRGLHLHDLGFFVLEMVIDGFDEAIGEFLNFAFHVA